VKVFDRSLTGSYRGAAAVAYENKMQSFHLLVVNFSFECIFSLLRNFEQARKILSGQVSFSDILARLTSLKKS